MGRSEERQPQAPPPWLASAAWISPAESQLPTQGRVTLPAPLGLQGMPHGWGTDELSTLHPPLLPSLLIKTDQCLTFTKSFSRWKVSSKGGQGSRHYCFHTHFTDEEPEAQSTPPVCTNGNSVGSVVKNPLASAGDLGSIPGLGRSPGVGDSNPLQYSCLGNPMNRGDWQTTVHAVANSQTD